MEDFILRHRKEIIFSLIFLTLFLVVVIFGKTFISFPPFFEKAQAQSATSSVSVTAIVEAWLFFQVSTSSVTLRPPLVQADGTLNVGSSTAITLSLGTNNPTGWGIDIRGTNNGLYSTLRNYTIPSVLTTSTIATGTEAYGANATSTASGVIIGSYYNYYGTNTVGRIRTTDSDLADKNTPNNLMSVANLQIKATAAATTTPANDYSDTIILTASVAP